MRKSQSLSAYSLLFVIATLALYGMVKYFQRGFQGKVASLSDSMVAPQSEHLPYTDTSMVYNAKTNQGSDQKVTLHGDGSQTKISNVNVNSTSFTETTDDDYVFGDD